MPNGTLTVYASVAGQAAPLPGVRITVRDESGALLAQRTADAAGAAAVDLPAPDAQYSLDEENTAVRPYAVYRLEAALDGWQTQVLDGVQVFDGQQTVARLAFLPDSTAVVRGDARQVTTIPPHALFAGGGGSGPTPQAVQPRVLSEVVIPQKITVHLGAPSSSARNVTVPFQDYIANVASSEVYPTWKRENAL